MAEVASTPEGFRYFNHDFDFMVRGGMSDTTDNVFREAARMHLEDEGERLNPTFKYGEMPYSNNTKGYFAIYAEGLQARTWVEAGAQQDILFDKIVTHLGRLGITLLNRDYVDHDGDISLVDGDGRQIAILSGKGIAGGDDNPDNGTVHSWGVNVFPEVNLTKAE